MNIIKIKTYTDIPDNFTGVVEWGDGSKTWIKNGKRHRADGPAYVRNNRHKQWWLDGYFIWNSESTLNLTNQIVLSKTKHPECPMIQVWRVLDPNGLYDFIVIPGMEEFITE